MDYKIVIIGTGFGASMTGLSLAERTQGTGTKILMLERGTWWTTPVSTVQDKEVGMYDFLKRKDQPVQFWSAQNDFRGFRASKRPVENRHKRATTTRQRRYARPYWKRISRL